ncbi:DNA-binding protein [Diplocarpon rosae]|nr:DNA-binding protein [Diplocarpon rosae]
MQAFSKLRQLFSSSAPQPSEVREEERGSDTDGDMVNTAINSFDGSADVSTGIAAEDQHKKAKHLRRSAKKQRRKDALKSSVLDSSVVSSGIDSSVKGKDVDAPQTKVGQELAQKDHPPRDINLSNGADDYDQGEEEELNLPKVITKDKLKKERRKARASKRQAKVAALESDNFTQVVEPVEYEHESQDLVAARLEKRLAKKEAKKKKSKKTSLADEIPSTILESKDGVSTALSQSENLIPLPTKTKKGKQKAQKNLRKLPQDESAIFENADNSAALLQSQPTPAFSTHSRSQVADDDDDDDDVAELEAQIQSSLKAAAHPRAEEDHQQEPERPSKRALGKRKEPGTIPRSNVKRRRTKAQAAMRAELANYGLVSSQGATSVNNAPKSTPPSHFQSAIHDPVMLGETAAKLYASQMETGRNLASRSDASSSGSPPSSDSLESRQQRRDTPVLLPVNRRKAKPPLLDLTERDPYELPPSSQPELQPEPEPEAEPTELGVEPGVEPAEEPRDELEASALLSEVPKSSKRRKRRLPTGEPESSQVQLNPKTVKRKGSTSKDTKSETIKMTASSQATPTAKGHRIADKDAQVMNDAVELYRDMHDLTQSEVNRIVQEDATKDKNKKFWNFICERVPKIPRVNVMNLCRRRFHNFDARGVWTDEQDQDLKDAYERNPGKWKVIGEQLNRFSEDCRDRWRNYLVCGDKQKKNVWDKEEEEKFKKIVDECMRLTKTTQIDWQNVSSRMGHTRSRLQCITKWKKLQQREGIEYEDPSTLQPVAKSTWRLEVAENIAHVMTPGEKLDLLHSIRRTNAGTEGKIPWNLVRQYLGTGIPRMALRVAFRSTLEHIGDREGLTLQEVVSALIEIYEKAAPDEPRISGDSVRRRPHNKRNSVSGHDEDNGEGPSTQKSRQSKGRKAVMMAEIELDNDRTTFPKKASKKLRSCMKGENEVQSQETNSDTAHVGDDIRASFETVKNSQVKGRTPARKAKKPIAKAKTSKRLSEYRVNASEDEDDEQVVAEESITQKSRVLSFEHQTDQNDNDTHLGDDFQHDEDKRRFLNNPQSDEEEVPELDIEMVNNHHPAPNGHDHYQDADDIEDESEDYSYLTHDKESVDLDEPQSVTASRSHNNNSNDYESESEDESENPHLGREESVDLDTPRNAPPHPLNRYSNDDDEEVGLGANGSDGGFVRSTTVSSSASSIPHTPRMPRGNRGRP